MSRETPIDGQLVIAYVINTPSTAEFADSERAVSFAAGS
jgi:uncharacterized membrane protein